MMCLVACLIAALGVMILMPVVFGMDDDTATNDESELLLLLRQVWFCVDAC